VLGKTAEVAGQPAAARRWQQVLESLPANVGMGVAVRLAQEKLASGPPG
jgi:hypothetical protein